MLLAYCMWENFIMVNYLDRSHNKLMKTLFSIAHNIDVLRNKTNYLFFITLIVDYIYCDVCDPEFLIYFYEMNIKEIC